MTKAYSYIRMSTSKQLKGHSFSRQLDSSETYAKDNNLELDNSLQDIGISAFRSENIHKGALGKFLKKIEDGEIDTGSYLLIESLDRLSRDDVLDALQLFISIISSGIIIVTLMDKMVYSRDSIKKDYSQLIISLTIMSRAHDESLQKSQRISMSWEKKRQLSNQKKLTSKCPAWLKLDKDKGEFKIIKKRANLVKEIYEQSKNGMGNFSIARYLNKKGIESWGKSNGWHPSYIQKLLNNRSVLGEFQPHKFDKNTRVPTGTPISSYFPQIIEDDLYYLVKAAKENRKSGGGRKGKTLSNLFSRIAKCGYCGTTMQFINKGKPPKGGQYLICGNAHRNLGCHKTTWIYKDFETSFLTYVSEISLKDIFDPKTSNTTNTLSQQIVTKEQKLKENEKQLNKLKDAFRKTSTPPQTFMEMANNLEDENAILEKEINKLKGKIIEAKREPKQLKSSQKKVSLFLKRMSSLKDNELLDIRSKISQHIQNLIRQIDVYHSGITKNKIKINETKIRLKACGYTKKEIDTYFKSLEPAYNIKSSRYYMVIFKNDKFRFIKPDYNDPTKFEETIYSGGTEATPELFRE